MFIHIFILPIFYIILLLHGINYLNPSFYKFFIGPAILFLIDRLYRYYKQQNSIGKVLSITLINDGISIEFAKSGPFKSSIKNNIAHIILSPRETSSVSTDLTTTSSSSPIHATVAVLKPRFVRGLSHLHYDEAMSPVRDERSYHSSTFTESQYVYLKCPSISASEWHPFSISSAMESDTVHLHIRDQGENTWTHRVKLYLTAIAEYSFNRQKKANLLDKSAPIEKTFLSMPTTTGEHMHGMTFGTNGLPLFNVDGPYADPTQYMINQHTTVLLIGAGFAASGLASAMKSIVFNTWKYSLGNSRPNNAYFVWLCRYSDLAAFKWMVHTVKVAADEFEALKENDRRIKGKVFEFHIFVTQIPNVSNAARRLAMAAVKNLRNTSATSVSIASSTEMSTADADRLASISSDATGLERTISAVISQSRGASRRRSQSTTDLRQLERPQSRSQSQSTAVWGRTLSRSQSSLSLASMQPKLSRNGPRPRSVRGVVSGWTESDLEISLLALENGHHIRFGDVHVWSGRPNWRERLNAITRRHPREDCGVMVCGSRSLTSDMKRACYDANVTRQTYANHTAGRFYMFAENA